MTQARHADWFSFDEPPFGFAFRYPAIAPSGSAVTVRRQEREDRRRVHISTEDSREVYFELEHVDRQTVDEGVDKLAADLRSRFPDAEFQAPQPAALGSQPAQSMAFSFDDRQRVAIFTDQQAPAHRVIFDPRSSVNHDIFGTLRQR